MNIKGIFYVALYVSDLARSKQFYAEKLGWKLHTEEPGVAGLSFGEGYVVLLAATPSHATGAGGTVVAVKVTEIDAEHARLAQHGVGVGELLTQPWGERNFSFKDPDGYAWSYGEIKGGA